MVGRRRSAVPAQSVSRSSAAGHIIQVGSTTGDVLILLDRPDYRLEFLGPTSNERRVPRSQRQPSYLLDPRREVVPYRPRVEEQHRLEMWRDDAEEPVSVLMVSGAGGQGKTRLASHVASVSYQAGWAVAQGVERTSRLQIDRSGQAVLGDGQSLLVVVDYAERWRLGVLAQLVYGLPLDYPDRRVRVLLLARPGPGLWDTMAAELDRGGIDLAEPVELGEFVHDETERAAAFAEAAQAFASQMETPAPQGVRLTGGPLAAEYTSPLTLHMSALAAVCAASEDQPVPKVQDLSRFLLNHERRYWNAPAETGHGPSTEVIEQMVFLATVFGPVAGLSAGRVMLRRARLADADADAGQLLTAHERLYPSNRVPLSDPSGGALADVETLLPLRPDRFGEDFVGQYLTQRPHAAPLLAELLATELDVLSLRRCLIVLAAASPRYPTAGTVLFALLRSHSHLTAHVNSGVLQLVVDYAPDDVAAAVEEALPRFSTELLRPACSLAQRLHSSLPTDAPPALVARRLTNLGIRLAEVGDKRAAVVPTQQAVDTYRGLARAEPAGYLPALANALNNLGNRLLEVGDNRAALVFTREAVDTYRSLAQAEPAAYLPPLAGTLNNLGACLSKVGENRAALVYTREAVDTYRSLAQAEPAAYHPFLAMSLTSLGRRLLDVGDNRAALAFTREAVDTYRSLAQAEPAAYLPPLAIALNNLGTCLSEVGDKQAGLAPAREAVDTYRGLVQAEPAAYFPGLAGSLSILGKLLLEVGDKRAALASAREAVEIRRRLAQAEPAAHLQTLAGAQNTLSVCLSEVGDKRAALVTAREAVEIYRRLAQAESAAYLPDLAGALSTLGNRLAEVGDKRAALASTQEAADTYRRLAQADPAAYLPGLAIVLNNLGVRLSEVGNTHAALVTAREAVEIRRGLAQAEPAAYLSTLAGSLNNLSVHLSKVGDKRAALAPAQEAVDAYRCLARADPAAYLPGLAIVLNNLGARLSEVGNTHAALAPTRQAAEIHRRLAQVEPPPTSLTSP